MRPTTESAGPDADESAFRAFAERLQGGDEEAASQLLARYTARLLASARRHLNPKLKVKCSEDDILQSAFRTFFRRLGEGGVELRDWDSLSGFLSLLVLRKCYRQAARHRAERRDLRRELTLPPDLNELHVPDRDPTPEEVATFAELLERTLERLQDRDREMVAAVIAGDEIEDVRRRFRCSRRTVERKLARVRTLLLQPGHKGF